MGHETAVASVNDHRVTRDERAALVDAATRGEAAPVALAIADRLSAAGFTADLPALLVNAKECAATSRALKVNGSHDEPPPIDEAEWALAGASVPIRSSKKPKPNEPNKPAEPWRAQVIVASDMDESPPPPARWIVPGLIPAGMTVIAGRPKAGKSIFAMGLALANCGGTPFLGRPVVGGATLYLDLENGKRRIYERLKMAMSGRPLPSNLHLVNEWKRGNRDEFRRLLDEHPAINLAIIDIWSKFRAPINARDDRYQQDEHEMQWLANEANTRGIATAGVMHLVKSEAIGDPYTAVTGSVAVAGNADALLLLKRTDAAERSLRFVGRDLDDTEWLLTPAQPIGFEYRCDAAEVATPDQVAYLVAIRDCDKSATQAEIARRVGVTPVSAMEMLKRLRERDYVRNLMGPYSLTDMGERACAHVREG